MNDDLDHELDLLHRELGMKRLGKFWAKAEIFGGLAMVGVGLTVMIDRVKQLDVVPGGLLLFVLGGYLAMAGHRSHLYQSNNQLAAWLSRRLREIQTNGPAAKEPS